MVDIWALNISSGAYEDYRETDYLYEKEEDAIAHKEAIEKFLSDNEYALRGYGSEYAYFNSNDSYDYDLQDETQNCLAKLVGDCHSYESRIRLKILRPIVHEKFENPF